MSTLFSPVTAEPDEPAGIIFFKALKMHPDEREAFLNVECSTDTRLRTEVEGLLRDHDKAGSFLSGNTHVSPELETEFARLKPEQPGERIGPYKLLEQIGEGGFGVVWVAEQEKPVRRRVALKIIKLGMDTKEVIARFEQERQALAMMDHPNIARVLDAGATPLGRPYFVMELVRGIKITSYCDQANLPTAERLRLFIAVCHAVQHAHQKGIIHRDLKPSNILVTLHDGVPVPKVIDFGVAKATQQQRLTDLTIYTQFEQMVGTPLYMSPEQAEMSGLDIDTRSDIYSLGVLLYELLVGRTPFDPETLMKRGLDEIRRAVREQEPQKPSTFVSTMAIDLRTNLAQHRQTDSAKLIGQIRGDLDWIVMKALEKDRSRRYDTANNLAQDIQRHLASEPVQARPPTQLYRFRRFAKRNKIAFAAASAVLAALLSGLGVSTWMYIKEKQARDRAVAAEQEQVRLRQLAEGQEKKATTEASKSGQVAQFLTDMLNGVGPSVALGRDTRMLREILDKTAERIGQDLKDQPDVEAELRSVIGEIYVQLGEYGKAESMHGEALRIRREFFGDENTAVASSLRNMADALHLLGNFAEAEIMHRDALAMRRRLLGDEHKDVAQSLHGLGEVLHEEGRFAEAQLLLGDSLVMRKRVLGAGHNDVAESLDSLASLFLDLGKRSEAESIVREALEIRRKLFGSNHPDVADTLNSLACALGEQKLAEKESMLRESMEITRRLLGAEHPAAAIGLHNLALVVEGKGKYHEAESMLRQSLAVTRERMGPRHPAVAHALTSLAGTLRDQGRLADSEALYGEALVLQKQVLGDEHPHIARTLHDLAETLSEEGKYVEAEARHREALAMRKKLLGNEHPEVAQSLRNLAGVLLDRGKEREAESFYREALAIQSERSNRHPNTALALNGLGQTLATQGKCTEAETTHRQALAMQRELLGNEHPDVAAYLNNLALVLRDEGKAPEAETMLREALAIWRKHWGSEHRDVASALQNLASVLLHQSRLEEAESISREALAMRKKLFGNEHPDVAASLENLADVMRHQDKTAEAEALYREALAMRRMLFGDEHPEVAVSLNKLGIVLVTRGKSAEAETLYREALALRRKIFGNEHWRVAETLNNLAEMLRGQQKLPEAEAMHREALRMERILGPENIHVAISLHNLALVLTSRGKLAEAEPTLREALAMARKLWGNDHPNTSNAFNEMAKVLVSLGKLAEVETMCREELARRRKLLGNEHPRVASMLNRLAILLRNQGKLAEAEPMHRDVLVMARNSGPEKPSALEAAMLELAENLNRQNKYAEAEPLYREAMESRRARMPADHDDLLLAIASLARVLSDWSWSERGSSPEPQNTKPENSERAREAERLLRDCLAVRLRGTDSNYWRTADVRSRLGGAVLAVAVTDPAPTSEARLAKLAEAEELMLKGNEGLQHGEKVETRYIRDSLTRIVRLYQAWDQPEKAAGWQHKLDDFDKAEAKPEAGEKDDSPEP